MADEKQAESNRERVDGEDDRDRERGEPIALRIKRPQRGGNGGECHRSSECKCHKPEPDGTALRPGD
jgi:hypothetical protein